MEDLRHLRYRPSLQVLQYKKAFAFPSLYMHANFYVAFTLKIVNQPHLPSNVDSNFLPLVPLIK